MATLEEKLGCNLGAFIKASGYKQTEIGEMFGITKQAVCAMVNNRTKLNRFQVVTFLVFFEKIAKNRRSAIDESNPFSQYIDSDAWEKVLKDTFPEVYGSYDSIIDYLMDKDRND